MCKTYAVVFQNQRTGKVGMDQFTEPDVAEGGEADINGCT